MSGTIPPEALERSIPERFHEVVERHPDRPAVQYDSGEIRYRALGDRVRSVAALIRTAAPATPGAVVLLIRQGIPQVAAILGVLEAGDWYVPLDPNMDTDVLRELIVRAEAKLVLADETTRAIAERAASGACPVACADGALPPPLAQPSPATPDSLAYVYFTSGTTGVPKGVMDSHRNVIHNVLRYGRSLAWTLEDRLTLLQASHFSGAVSNVFGALLNGALLLPYDVDRDGAGAPLARWVEQVRPTVFHAVPSLYRSSIGNSGARYPSIRIVRLEGDAGSIMDTVTFNQSFKPGAQLVHGLGATETGIAAQYFHLRGESPSTSVLPIGRATEDMEVQVLLEGGVPAPPGEVGELVVRSRYLALGYWKDPDRTEVVFGADPAEAEVRTYRTGDLGRVRDDGLLEHLGRKDRQLKVRGQWVDAAAVEGALASMPSVREAAVALDPIVNQEALAAWLVTGDGFALDGVTLRRELARRFPAHAVPGRFYSIAALPLGPNGKLNRAALAAGRRIHDGTDCAQARNAREETLLEMWKAVLAVGELGIHDRFLEHGGDSLKAVMIVQMIENRFHITIPHSILVEAPTVAELAARLDADLEAAKQRVLIPLQTHSPRQPLFCVHDLESSAFLFAPLAWQLSDHPVYALTPPVGEPVRTLPRTIEALAARYLDEMMRVAPAGPYAIAGFCFGGVVALEMAHQLRERGADISLLALVNVTAYDLPALVSKRARTRFRIRWGARIRYLRSKPDMRGWLSRRVVGTAGRIAGRATLPLRLAMSSDDAPALPSLVRASLVTAFDRYRARPHPGAVHLFLADETLPLYADDPHEAWAGVATGPIHIHRFLRDGYAMLTEPDVARVAHILAQSMA